MTSGRRRAIRWAAGIAVAALAYPVAYFGVFALWLAADCDGITRARQWSPDRRNIAVVFEWSCGATTGYVTHVAVTPWYRPFAHPEASAFLVYRGAPDDVTVAWTDERSIDVRVATAVEPYRRLDTIDGFRIGYR